MKVVLTENVKGIGKKLDVVNVSEGYARNYLIPRNLAKPADNKSLSEANTKKAAIKFKQDTERDLAAKKKSQIESENNGE
jgi:large subunit ribosomal protein L9